MTPDTDALPKDPETVSCCPPAANWFLPPFITLYAVGFVFLAYTPSKSGPPAPGQAPVCLAAAAILLLGALGVALWQRRAQIKADADGLHWRRFGRWKSARWEEVRDYYDRLPLQSQGRIYNRAFVKTERGSVQFSSEWTHIQAFRELVAQRATQAITQEWGVWGGRPCDSWPRMFRYDTWQNIWTPRILLKLVITVLGYLLVKPVQQAATMAGYGGWPLALALSLPYLMIVGGMGAFFLLPLAQYRAAGRRKVERIMADTHGVAFEDGTRRVEAAWADVTGYGILHGPGTLTVRYVVETRQGEFDFIPTLSNATLLQSIIQRYAAQAADKEWRPRTDPEALGGEAARWSSGQIGIGAYVYHYRTRVYRALLWLPAGMGLTFGLLFWVSGQGIPQSGNVIGGAASCGVCSLLFFGSWYVYRTCRVETDEDGLTQITPLGRRRLLWSQIEDYRLTSEGNGIVTGRDEQLWFGKRIVGYEELKAEIARRATECGGREWARRPTGNRHQTAGDGRAKKAR